ncbi:hypothetical protein GLYMA_02G233366v4 [Glycine max]|nr:hypothetical protein GLYMA_02G233366v4 [Glycine max]KAH1061728.1 hypothetical protein GYH30_004965 [Glycine max]
MKFFWFLQILFCLAMVLINPSVAPRQAEQEKGNFDTSGNSHVELINCFENLF